MNSSDYKDIIKNRNVLDYGTLKATLEQLVRANNSELADELKRILEFNKIEKPITNNNENGETTFYFVDLTIDQIESIVSLFGDLEVSSLGMNYEPTSSASFYATLLDRWNDLPEYR